MPPRAAWGPPETPLSTALVVRRAPANPITTDGRRRADATRLLRRAPGASDKPQTDGFGPLLPWATSMATRRPSARPDDAGTLERRGVHEDILSALIRSDKAEALIGVAQPLGRLGQKVLGKIVRALFGAQLRLQHMLMAALITAG